MTSSSQGLNSSGVIDSIAAICAIAICLNLLVILVVLVMKNFRGTSEIFMANMAVSDILLAGIAIPLKLEQAAFEGDFHSGNVGCKLIMFIPLFTIMVSISTMVAMSFDRFFVICHSRKLRKKGLIGVIVAIWLLAFAVAAPQFYEYSVYVKWEEEENKTEISCGSHGIAENFETIYAGIVVFVAYFLPVIVIIINYSRIGFFLWSASKRTHSQNGNVTALSKAKLRVLFLLGTITTVFALLWAPFFVLFTIEEVTGQDDLSETNVSHAFKETMIALSTLSNPVLYFVFNQKFRRAVAYVISCGKYKSGAVHPESETQPAATGTVSQQLGKYKSGEVHPETQATGTGTVSQ